jgi:negative regulator of flagellin synthesis FlgM
MAIELTGLASSSAQKSGESTNEPAVRTEPTIAQKETGDSHSAETITLSDVVQQLRSLESSLSALPVVDTQRVEQVRLSLINDIYDFNPDRVASKFLQFETQFAK